MRRGGQQHVLRGGTGDAHAVLARAPHGGRATGHLEAEPLRQLVGAVVHAAPEHGRHVVAASHANNVSVRVGVQRRRFLHADQGPVRLHLLCRHHREGRRRALPHLAMRNQDGDAVVGGHGDPGRQLTLLGCVGGDERVAAWCEREAGHSEQEASTRDGTCADERAPGPFLHDAAPFRWAASWMAARIRANVPHRQMFVRPASISSSVGFAICARSPATAMITPDWQ